jgi:hypothetical protein
MGAESTDKLVSVELQHEIEQFLYVEAELLDDGRFHEWLDLFADDVRYWMPTRYNRTRRERDREFSGSTEIAQRRASGSASSGWTPAWRGPRTRPRGRGTSSATSA